MDLKRHWDLLTIIALSLLLDLLIALYPDSILRKALGLAFVLFFPGYVFVTALFPQQTGTRQPRAAGPELRAEHSDSPADRPRPQLHALGGDTAPPDTRQPHGLQHRPCHRRHLPPFESVRSVDPLDNAGKNKGRARVGKGEQTR